MTLVNLPGGMLVPIGAGFSMDTGFPTVGNVTMDAAGEAVIFIGYIKTSDGGSHTIDTTGSSSLGWRTGASTFANAGTTVKVGLAPVLTTAGPPGRAANTTDVIDFDVSKSMVGGGGGVTSSAWQTHVPDAGTKTIADGDLVAFAVQMTARAGADSVLASYLVASSTLHRPNVTSFLAGVYAAVGAAPNAIITFSDGAIGYFQSSSPFSALTVRTWNSGSATKEYGQLFKMPFPMKITGFYGTIDPDADFDVVLYSDPLGTPVAERTISMDANTMQGTTGRRFDVAFPAYSTTANQLIGAVFKPGASNITAYFRTLASATHRVADVWGTDGYGISRASGAFADANSGLDHYLVGLVGSGFDDGAGGGSGIPASRLQLGH